MGKGGGVLLENKKIHFGRKLILILAVAGNFGLLGYFKYRDFFVENINYIFRTDFHIRNILLPLGISFFTFQQLSFVIDVYRSEEQISYSLLEYAAYVTFFPQLIAGPIVTHDILVKQLQNKERKRLDWDNLAKGLALFSFGLAKKVLLADVFGNAVNVAFEHIDTINTTTTLVAILSYTIQIYFDFSGYSDMAVGLGWMLNIDLPVNFDSPYKALSVTEFWKRWHITLTSFFTKYLYIPLGGNQRGKVRTYVNIFIVFLLSGLWHGAGWNYVLWGAMHGIAQILERVLKKQREQMHPALSWMLTFGFVNAAWGFFRADSIRNALRILNRVLILNSGPVDSGVVAAFAQPEWRFLNNIIPRFFAIYPNIIMLVYFLTAFFLILGIPNAKQIAEKHIGNKTMAFITAILLVWSIFSFSGVSTFLYFNF